MKRICRARRRRRGAQAGAFWGDLGKRVLSFLTGIKLKRGVEGNLVGPSLPAAQRLRLPSKIVDFGHFENNVPVGNGQQRLTTNVVAGRRRRKRAHCMKTKKRHHAGARNRRLRVIY